MPTKHMAPFEFNIIGCKTLYNKDLPSIEYLVDKFIMKGGLTYLVGGPGSFKTGVMLLTSLCGARGQKVLNFDVKKPFRTLFIDEENGIINTKFKFAQILRGLEYDIDDFKDDDIIFSNISSFKFNELDIHALEDLIKKYKPNLIVIDNIARCLVGSERDEKDVAAVFNMIKPLIEKYRVSFVIIHHTRKGSGNTLEDISGSRDFGAQCDGAFILSETNRENDKKEFTLTQKKIKYGIEIPDVIFNVSGNADKLIVEYEETSVEKKEKWQLVRTETLDFILMEPDQRATFGDILDAVKHIGSERLLHNVIDWMVKKYQLKRVKKGVYAIPKKND